jgi:predicted metalloprotease with PDZ domain
MPVGLATRNYQEALTGELIWVYEGLTEYLGTMLTARSGFWTPEQFREAIALDAGEMATHPGRRWRSIEDTAIGVQLLNTAPGAWLTERRSTDFYPEGALIWMEADTRIRKRSGGTRSLDDFCRAFLASALDGTPKSYTFDDVVATLDSVQHDDWKTFFTERLSSHSAQPPTGGITGAGWKLTYVPDPTELIRHLEQAHKTDVLWPLWNRLPTVDARFSIGVMLSGDGTVIDVSRDMSAFQAGIAPGMRIISVNGQPFAPEVLHRAIAATAGGEKLVLVREHNGVQASATVSYAGGERFPTLVRNAPQEDLVPQLVAPHAPGAAQAIR